MRIKIILGVALVLLTDCDTQRGGSAQLDAKRMHHHIRVLAADEMEGRGAGYAGERRASEYIAQQFRQAGLEAAEGSYFRPFEFRPVGGVAPFQRLEARNVVGLLRGGKKPNELIVLGAHYDGQGMTGQIEAGRLGEGEAGSDRIWNSASDNATSVAALIEIARVLASAGAPPARTIAFVAFSAEENRLNGAFDYVRNPPLPWSQHIAMINLEKLVGHEATEFMLATDGSSSGFAAIAKAAAAESGLDAKSFDAGIVSDTDHFAFNLAGLPALVIGTGADENIHQNSDVAETLQLDPLEQRVRYVLAFVRAIANDDQPMSFTSDVSAYSGIVGGLTTPAEMKACGLKAPGFLVTELGPRSKAERSGLRVGDVVVAANGKALLLERESANFLEQAAGTEGLVKIRVACGATTRELELELTAEE